MSPILGIIASSFRSAAGPDGAYDALSTVTLASATSTVTFAGIPTGYKHLQIRTTFTSSAAVNPQIRFNEDTSSVYSWHHLYGEGSGSGLNNGAANQSFMYFSFLPNTSYPASTITDIFDYTSTSKNKIIRTLSGSDANGSGEVALWSGNWRNSTNAINSISIINPSGNFTTNSQFALYGVK